MSFTTNEARLQIWNRSLNLTGDTLKVMLVSAGYVPDKDHVYVSAITGGASNELSGPGYPGGFGDASRQALASKTLSKDNTLDLVKLYANDVTWSALNCGTIRYIAIIKEGTSDADSLIVAILDVNPTAGYTTDGNDFLLKASSGLALSKAA